MGWARSSFGSIPRQHERYEPLSFEESVRLRDQWIEATRKMTGLALELARGESWEFFLTVFAATHRSAHKLWGPEELKGDASPGEIEVFNQALHRVYIECDRSVGRLAEMAGGETTLMVFSLHGMGSNTSRYTILPEMLKRVLNGGDPGTHSQPLMQTLKRMRQAVPSSWRYKIKHRLPVGIQDRLGMFWRMGDIDWSQTTAFSMISDLQGFIRINLKGREMQGIVEPGAEYESLCKQICTGLKTFVDSDTLEPLVREISPSDLLFPPGSRMEILPDLIVKWSEQPARQHKEVCSPLYGAVTWPTPFRNPDSHSGNHRGQGFLIASGRGFAPGSKINKGHILDLAPTAMDLLGMENYPGMQGKSLLSKTGE
jgi:predicted AlkP superfamily phosphohydrolase/phosphomutase